MPLVDFVTREGHFRDHLAPIFHALPDDWRGRWISSELARGEVAGEVVVVASWGDLKRIAAGTRIIHVEHGVGLWSGVDQPNYSGGSGKEAVSLFLVPNQLTATRNEARYPKTPNVVVGVPRLDYWSDFVKAPDPIPTVTFAFHFSGNHDPEHRSAFEFYQRRLKDIVRHMTGEVTFLGHGHPRAWPQTARFWKAIGVEAVQSFDEVMRRTDLYVADNSSTMYEFAATDRPVLALNAPWYRRDRSDGHPRFWSAIPGLQCEGPDNLADMIRLALNDPMDAQTARRAAVASITPHVGTATPRAVAAILRWGRGL